jgi:hypothetical protein
MKLHTGSALKRKSKWRRWVCEDAKGAEVFLPQRARGNTKVDRAIEQNFFTAKDAKSAENRKSKSLPGYTRINADQQIGTNFTAEDTESTEEEPRAVF